MNTRWTHIVVSAPDPGAVEKARLLKEMLPGLTTEVLCKNAHDAEICRSVFQAADHKELTYGVIALT